MPMAPKRKYEKIDEAEIDLVVQCEDSHEFYERYRALFPTKKKGIDSINKIWKRRSEFLKKLNPASEPLEPAVEPVVEHEGEHVAESTPGPVAGPAVGISHELELLITAQNKILAELSGVMKEHLKFDREILARLPKQVQTYNENIPGHGETKTPEQKEPGKKTSRDKPSQILIGS